MWNLKGRQVLNVDTKKNWKGDKETLLALSIRSLPSYTALREDYELLGFTQAQMRIFRRLIMVSSVLWTQPSLCNAPSEVRKPLLGSSTGRIKRDLSGVCTL